jgi:hypothetical protein
MEYCIELNVLMMTNNAEEDEMGGPCSTNGEEEERV